MKSLVQDQRRINVIRNPWHFIKDKRYEQPWLVKCGFCSPDRNHGGFPFDLFNTPARTLGWAPTWEVAMAHARQHAADHEKTRCPTCECIPELDLPARELS